MAEIDDLKKTLKEELEKESVDFSKIILLSQQIAAHDEENVRFTIDASHVSKLGLELVAKQETAVAELVKNAYDADAINVDLIFSNTDQAGGTLEVIDNGCGMTRQQLIDGFMRISTADKVCSPSSENFKRQRAGRKGIGRFASQRLGTRLTIFTQTSNSDFALKVLIDWTKFEASLDLNTISNKIDQIEKLPSVGTTLVIEKLRDSWSTSQIKRAYRYISDLQQPFPIAKKVILDSDPGFKAAFYRKTGEDLTPVADEDTTFFEHALATIDGRIDENGHGFLSVRSEKLGLESLDNEFGPDRNLPKSAYEHLPPLSFRAYYFILAGGTGSHIPRSLFSVIRDNLSKNGGIRLYRNTFRVLPYGEPYDDWLKLAKSSAVRELLPPHNNTNFIGFVEISDPEGFYFEETSSREGLFENQSFRELQDFVSRGIKSGVVKIAELRSKKTRASQKSVPTESFEERTKRLAMEILGDGKPEDEPSGKPEDEPSVNSKAQWAEEVLGLGLEGQRLLEENALLRVLASLGLTIGEFTHEIRHSLAAMVANLNLISLRASASPEIEGPCEGLKSNLGSLQSYAKFFDDAITDNAHRQLQPLELRDMISIFENVVEYYLSREQVQLTKDIQGYDLFTKPMHRSEWSSILLNLFSNSIKAINRSQADGKIFLRAGETNGMLFLEFADNGDGIPAQNTDKIFDAFFTTSTPPGPLALDSEELTGTGLGLKIVRDIIESIDGEICLVTPPEGYSTCFRIEVPRARKEEIPEDAY